MVGLLDRAAITTAAPSAGGKRGPAEAGEADYRFRSNTEPDL